MIVGYMSSSNVREIKSSGDLILGGWRDRPSLSYYDHYSKKITNDNEFFGHFITKISSLVHSVTNIFAGFY